MTLRPTLLSRCLYASRSKPTQPRIDDFVPTFSGQVFCYLCKAVSCRCILRSTFPCCSLLMSGVVQDITGSAQIQCVTCPSTVKPVDLCPQCMVLDTQAGEHKRSHEYRVMDNLAIPLSEDFPDWTAEEELRLLEGIQQFGFGNWKYVPGICGAFFELYSRPHLQASVLAYRHEVCRESPGLLRGQALGWA